MQLGIFAKTFPRSTLAETLDAVVQHDLYCIQFNMSCAGLPSMPEAVEPALIAQIQAEMQSRQVSMAAISGTFNMAHPDPDIRRAGLRRLGVLSKCCKAIGTSIITLCTGTRDPADMWRWHAENTSSQAWRTLLETMSAAVRIAEDAGITLAFEPERANVVYNARLARELLTCMASPNLKVVLDPANIIDGKNPAAIPDVIDEAFDLLGDHIVMAHAKDKGPDDEFRAAGKGLLDYARYLKRLDDMHFDGALILHSLEEWEVDTSLKFLRNTMPLCPCFTQPFDYRDYVSVPIGVDLTNQRFGEVTIQTCKHCGAKWLHYLVEYEAFTGSGRWFRGPISDEALAAITPQAAIPYLEQLSWYFAGGSYYHSSGLRSSGKIPADL